MGRRGSGYPVSNAVVRLAISTAPTSAVPSDAPRLVAVFCSPPTSPLWVSGTADAVTAPNCDANAPTPNPISTIGTATTRPPHRSSPPKQQGPGEDRQPRTAPLAADRPGCESGDAHGRRQQGDRHGQDPDPGLQRRQTEHHGQEQRHREEHAGLNENWKKNIVRPPVSCGFPQHLRAHQRLCAAPRAASPTAGRPTSTRGRRNQPDHRRDTNHSGRQAWANASPLARTQDTEDEHAQTGDRQHRPDGIQLRGLLRRRITSLRAKTSITTTIATSPTNTHAMRSTS